MLRSLMILFLAMCASVDVFAMDTGFTTEPMSEEDTNTFLKNTNISLLTREPQRKAIECFDVREDGMIAIGFGSYVCIYSSDGVFQYGYSFETNGKIGVELNESALNIYFVRSDVAVAVNPKGEIRSVETIQNTTQNNSYWNHSVYLTKRKIGEMEYVLQNDMGPLDFFASSYSQLAIIEGNGKTRIIYDVNSEQVSDVLDSAVFGFLIICLGICFAIKNRRNVND